MKFGIGVTLKVDENFKSVFRKTNIDVTRAKYWARYKMQFP